jgi:hypothetical protein
VKPFDIDLNWMSKFRNQEKAAFWMADDDYGMKDLPRCNAHGTIKTDNSLQNEQKCSKKPVVAAA